MPVPGGGEPHALPQVDGRLVAELPARAVHGVAVVAAEEHRPQARDRRLAPEPSDAGRELIRRSPIGGVILARLSNSPAWPLEPVRCALSSRKTVASSRQTLDGCGQKPLE